MSEDMLGVALREACGPFNDFNQKLAGPDGEKWFRAFKKFLRKEDLWKIVPEDFPVWSTITLGIYPDGGALIKALEHAGHDIGEQALRALVSSSFNVNPTVIEVDLFLLSLAELGIRRHWMTYPMVIRAAEEIGFQRCSDEVAPQILLQCQGEEKGVFTVLMNTMFIGGQQGAFMVVLGSGHSIHFDIASVGRMWEPSDRIILMRSRKTS